MTNDELAGHYLKIAERLTGKDLHQMLDRVEALLGFRAGTRLMGTSLVTAEGVEAHFADGSKSSTVDTKLPQEISNRRTATKTTKAPKPKRAIPHGGGVVRRLRNGRFYAQVRANDVKYTDTFDTHEEAEQFVLVHTPNVSSVESIANLLEDALPLGRNDEPTPLPELQETQEAFPSPPFHYVSDALYYVIMQEAGREWDVTELRDAIEPLLPADPSGRIPVHRVSALAYNLTRKFTNIQKVGSTTYRSAVATEAA